MPTVLRCTAKLLARMRIPAKPPEPGPSDNPLGEWYADLDTWRREPFVVMLNVATGATLVLPGRAADLRRMHIHASLQFAVLCEYFGLAGPAVAAETECLESGFMHAPTCDRSILGSLNERKVATWMHFEHDGSLSAEAAARAWDGLYKHPSLGPHPRTGDPYHRPLDLLRARLSQPSTVIQLDRWRSRHRGDC